MTESEKLESSVLSLTAKERVRILVSLIKSLEVDDHAQSWKVEIERRLKDYRENPDLAVDGDAFIASLRNRVRG